MSFALEFGDYLLIAIIVIVCSGGAAGLGLRGSRDTTRLAQLDRKLDAILRHLDIEYADPASPEGLSERVRDLARDPTKKIQAIKLHRQETGLGLKEAKDAVEGFLKPRD
jgi:hypothetical protein